MEALLRRNFGWHHANVIPRSQKLVYTPRDLRLDERLHPRLRSIAGHALKPFVDFGEYADRLKWYTILRDPVARFMSHFEHQATRKGYTSDLTQWMRKYRRSNFQVRMIAGEEDVAAAIQIVEEKFACIGIQDAFNESLLMFRHLLQLDDFDVYYARPANVGDGELRRRIQGEMENHREEVIQQNELDVQLYEYAWQTIWPRQVKQYGKERLDRDVRDCFLDDSTATRRHSHKWQHDLQRNLIYKPTCYVHRQLTRMRRCPEDGKHDMDLNAKT